MQKETIEDQNQGQNLQPRTAANNHVLQNQFSPYPLDSSGSAGYDLSPIEVRDPSRPAPKPTRQTAVPPAISSTVSVRKVILTSIAITTIFVILFFLAFSFATRNSSSINDKEERTIPSQSLNLPGGLNAAVGIVGNEKSVKVAGDLVIGGDLRVESNGFITTLKLQDTNSDNVITLPNLDGVICIDSNNCNYASQNNLTELENDLARQIAEIALPESGVAALNGGTGNVTLQGSTNRINVSTNNGVISFSTPQDIANTSSPTFSSLVLAGNLNVGGFINTALDCTTNANGGLLTTNSFGQLVCGDDDFNTSGVNSIGGTISYIPLFDSAQSIADSIISQSGTTITITGSTVLTGSVTLSDPALDCSSGANEGALTTNGSGQLMCTNDDGGGASAVTSVNSLTGAITIVGNSQLLVNTSSPNISLSVQNDSIGNTQLAFDTGQSLTTASSPGFTGLTLSSLNCTGNGNGGALTTNGSGVLICSDDDGGDGVGLSSLNGQTGGTQTFANDTNVTLVSAGDSHTLTWAGQLGVTRGGTGLSTVTTGDLLYASGANTVASLAVGSNGQCLQVVTGTPGWSACPGDGVGLSSLNGQTGGTQTFANDTNVTLVSAGDSHTLTWAGQLGVTRGGTGLSTVTTGDLLYASGANTVASLAVGSNGQCLQVVTGTPGWSACPGDGVGLSSLNGQTGGTQTFANDTNVTLVSAGDSHTLTWAGQLGVTRGGTGLSTVTTGDLLYASGANTVASLAVGSNGQCLQVVTGTPGWSACPGDGVGLSSLNGQTGGTQTFANDTNVTLVSAGDSHTLTWAGQLGVTRGGTGLSTVTTGDLLYASGANTVASLAVGSNGQCLQVVTGTPGWSACPGDGVGLSSLNGQTGGTQTFANDTNVTLVSAGDSHTLTWAGQLGVTRGGTGLSTVTTGDLLYASGANTVASLAVGSNGQCLQVVTGTPGWSACPGDGVGLSSLNGQTGGTQTFANDTNVTLVSAGDSHTLTWAGQLGVTRGGTGLSTVTTGDLLYASGANTVASLAVGSNGQCLQVVTGTPGWSACPGDGVGLSSLNGQTGGTQTFANDTNVTLVSAGDSHTLTWAGQLGVTRGGTGLSTVTTGDLLYASGANTVASLAVGSNGQCLQVVTGTPGWSACPGDGVGLSSLNGQTGGTQTFANDTNVTLVSAGDSHTLTWAGQLGVTRGGTGLSTVTTGDLLYASGANTVASLAVGSNGQCLQVVTGTPGWSACPGDGVGLSSLNGQTGGTQTFANDTNVTLVSAGDSHTLTWAGQLGVTRGGTGLSTVTTGDLLYASGANTVASLAVGSNGQCLQVVTGTPGWSACPGDGVGLSSLNGQTGGTQTFANDTNVTLVSAGDSHTLTWAGQLGVTRGGTGLSTVTTGDLLYASGANTVASLAVGSNGQCLQVVTGTPGWSACPGDGVGVTSVGTIDGGTPDGNGAQISAGVLYLQYATGTLPGLVSTGSQTFGGAKTFNNNLIVSGLTTLNGSIDLGDTTGDTITFTGRVDSNILPSVDNTYSLGSSTARWADLFLGPNSLNIGTDANNGTLSYDTTNSEFDLNRDVRIQPTTDTAKTFGVYASLGLNLLNANALNDNLTVTNTISRDAGSFSSQQEAVTLKDTGNVGAYSDIAIAPDGTARIIYMDTTNAQVSYIRCLSDDCSTFTERVIGTGANTSREPHIKVASDGYPRLLWMNGTTVNYAQCSDDDCTSMSSNTIGNGYEDSDFDLDSNDLPMFVISDGSAVKFSRCTDQDCTTVTSTRNVRSNTSWTDWFKPDIAISSDNRAYMVWEEEHYDYVGMTICDDTDCTTSSDFTFGSGVNQNMPSITLDSNDNPSVVFTKSGTSLLYCGDSACVSRTEVVIEASSNNASAKFGSDDLLDIVLYDTLNDDLVFKDCQNVDCSVSNDSVLDSVGDVGLRPALVMDSSDRKYVSFYDNGNSDLKYVYDGDTVVVYGTSLGSSSQKFGELFVARVNTDSFVLQPSSDNASIFRIQDSTGSYILNANSDNRQVSIGTSTSNESLTVAGRLSLVETTSPSATANYGKLFVKSSDSSLYFMNDSGTEFNLLTGGGASSVGAAGTLQFSDGAGNLNGDASNFFWDNTNKRLGIGTDTPSAQLQVVAGDLTSSSQVAITQTQTYNSPTTIQTGSNLNVIRSITADVTGGDEATLDNVTTQDYSGTTAATVNFNHEVFVNNAGLLLVTIAQNCYGGACDAITVTYGGQSMTQFTTIAKSGNPLAKATIFYLVNPPTGVNQVSVTSETYEKRITASSWNNVNQSTPLTDAQSRSDGSTYGSLNNTTSSLDAVVDVIAFDDRAVSVTAGSGQVVMGSNHPGNDIGASSYKMSTPPTTTTSWTGSSGYGHVQASAVINGGAGTASIDISGSLANLTSNCSITNGGCNDTSSILSLNQQFASATGTVLSIQNAGSGTSLSVEGDTALDTNTLFVDGTNDRVGIGTITPAERLHIVGGNIKVNDDFGLVLGTDSDATIKYDETTDDRVELTGSGASLFIEDKLGLGVQTLTIVDSGDASPAVEAAFVATSSYVEVNCQDVDGCTITLTETGAKAGDLLIFVNISSNAITIPDVADQVNGTGASLGVDDNVSFIYTSGKANNLWIQTSTSDN